jgi:predicted dehydrogenase
MAHRLRWGIVGCGVIASTHAAALAGLPAVELRAVADVHPERARALAAQYGVTPYSDLQEMLDREPLDVVTVCTPSGLHGRHACQIMRTGRHVLVEKPLEIRRAAMDEMLRVQQDMGVLLAVISQHRFDPASRQVRERLAAGDLGRLVLGSAQVPWWRAQAYYESGAWRGTARLDGGVLLNQAIHTIDLLLWLLGPVHSLAAYTATRAHRMEAEDVAVAVLRFTNGVLGTIAATTGAYPGHAARLEVYGDQGSAIIENDQLRLLHLARDDAATVGPYGQALTTPRESGAGPGAAPNPAAVPVSTHALQIADLIRAIEEGGTPLVDGQAARQPVDLILAIEESARTHREVILA